MGMGHALRTLAILGLGGFLGGGLVIALGERGAAKAEPGAGTATAVEIGSARSEPIRGWQKGKGWGWIWGKDDEVGSLNALSNASRAAALSLATRGEVFDLGLTYSRRSYKWPGHSPGEIITFRSPDGIRRMQDPDAPPPSRTRDHVYWHSAAMFISDNVATQIDGLAHITAGPRRPLVQRLQGVGLGRRLGPAQVRRVHHPADRRPRRADRRGRLQEGRRPAGSHAHLDPGPPGHPRLGRRDASARATSCWCAPAPADTGAKTAPITPRSPSTTRPAPTSPRRSGSSRTRGRSWSARTPAATRSTRRRLAQDGHPRPSLPARRPGRPPRRVPQPRRAEPGQGLRRSATSPPSTRSRAPPPASRSGRWRSVSIGQVTVMSGPAVSSELVGYEIGTSQARSRSQ